MMIAKNLVELADLSVARYADRPLFGQRVNGGWEWMSYAQWKQRVDQLRAGLAWLGVKPGERVAIVSRNSAAWATAAYACYGLGATFVPMYEAQRPSDWELILRDCGASVVFARTDELAAALQHMRVRLPALRHIISIEGSGDAAMASLLEIGSHHPVPPLSPSPDDIAGFVYTSGTTGQPKGAMLSHANLTSNVLATVNEFPLTSEDRTLSFLPWAHVYGQVVELHILIAVGASTAFNTEVTHLVDDLQDVKPTILVAVPRVFNQLHASIRNQMAAKPRLIRALFWRGHEAAVHAHRGEPLLLRQRVLLFFAGFLFAAIRRKLGGRLRYAISASATLSHEVAEFIDALGIELYEGYGLTETSPVVTMNRPGRRKMGSVGLPIKDVRIVIDESFGDSPGVGEIIVYGPNVMKGYHARPEENARAFTADGGLRTGDLGKLDRDGFLYITGRIKEQYKLENGKYVMPTPLEEQLALSPYIKNVMLYGDNRPFNVALVSIDETQLHEWELKNDFAISDPTTNVHVRALIASELARHAADFRPFERPVDFVLTTIPFTVENGLLTPTLKIKRREVVARFGRALDALYAEPTPVPELRGVPSLGQPRPAV